MVQASLPGVRFDQFLRKQFPPVSRGTFQRLIDEGLVTVNGCPIKPTQAPKAGDQVEIDFPEPKPAEARPQEIPIDILYEDSDLIVLNKAAGIVVHPSAGHDENTLVNALLHHCAGLLSGIGGVARPGIVHRLDKETSGCLVVAKHDSAHLELARQFAGRNVRKVYHALVCGSIPVEEGEIRAGIKRHPTHRKRMAVVKGGREAWTTFKVVERYCGITLVEALLHTGRTHQVRVHFQSLGFPLLGDATYGNRQNQRLAQELGFKAERQMLHASELEFDHPSTGKRVAFKAPWPNDFQSAVDWLIALREKEQ